MPLLEQLLVRILVWVKVRFLNDQIQTLLRICLALVRCVLGHYFG
jgi:hypothetical protein